MKNTQDQNSWDDSSQAKLLRFTLYFSLLKSIDDYSVTGKRWLSSISVGLLVILVGMIGIIPMAKADELLPEADTEGWQLGKAEAREKEAEGIDTEALSTSNLPDPQHEIATLSDGVEEESQLIEKQTIEPSTSNLLPSESDNFANTLSESIAQSHSSENLGDIEPARMESPLAPLPKVIRDEGNEVQQNQSVGADLTDNLSQETDNLSQPAQFDQSVGADLTDNLSQETGEAETAESELEAFQDEFSRTAQQTINNGLQLAPGDIRILTPEPGTIGDRTTDLMIQYHAESQVQVTINQQPLSAQTRTTIERDQTQAIVTQIWYGVSLKKGDNTITVAPDNGTPVSLELTVDPIADQTDVQITLTPVGDPRVPADGRSTITIEGSITRESGELIEEDAVVTLTAAAGEFVGADYDDDQLGFQVLAKNGQFSARLQSGLDAQKVRIRAAIERLGVPDIEQITLEESTLGAVSTFSEPIQAYTQIEFVTHLRPSLVSGVINLRIGEAGTNFWESRREFLNPDSIDDGLEADLDSAIFATGRIGEWLFTGAYNSDRALNETCDGITRLFRGPQFCENQYPVYGDSSTVDYLTPSKDSVYLRFERSSPVIGAEPDYAMWGDYNTTEFTRASQEFTATARALHGFKGNYNLGNLQVTALFSPDVEGFQRDTILPDGTSGYYFLSRRLLIPGSENVYIETEELNRPGTVIERKALYRGPDYEIDYDRGSLLFRRPMRATEFDPFGNTLVRRIVVTYQFEADDDTNIYGGRLQYNFSQDFQQERWIGTTYLRENQGLQNFELYGADFLVSLGTQGRVVGEYGHSTNESPMGLVTGNAYRLEAVNAFSDRIQGRAYYRSVEEGFANNATTSFTPGQTRYGASLAAQLSESTRVQASYDREDNFGIARDLDIDEFEEFFDLFNPDNNFNPEPDSRVDNSLTTFRAGVQQQIGTSDLTLEYVNRSREDNRGDTFDTNASQLVSRLNVPLNEVFTFRAQNELNLDDSDPLYPNRTTLGLDWAVEPGVTLRLAHQFFDGGLLDDNSITSLETITQYQLGENTSISSRYSVIGGMNGMTGQAALGLKHGILLAPGLRVNLGYERIADDIFESTAAGDRFSQPYAVGQSAASLGLTERDSFSVGVEYTANPDFKASARLEHRDSSAGDNTVISAAALGKVSPSLTALFRYQQASAASQLLEDLDDTLSVKLGLAYRNPFDDRFNALMRYEYRKNPSTIPDTLLFGSGTGSNDHVLSGEGIYAPNWRWEFYGKFALRRSTTDLADNFSNSSTIYLGQSRITYRLGYRMDLAVEGRWIGQPSVDFDEWGWALETGYYVTPDLRVGVGYSFGSVDDRDFTGYRSEGGPYLNVTFKVNELFGGFGRQKVAPPPQQEESQVQPVANNEPAANPTSEE
ncbi:MAG: hypothetical protein RH949_10690 [Coleofasciculus sp. A1-SPW-01]|uniref:hypothetical protein n=1 Tax=Coleofasciculus sp. A1-SPW-01 TaxID=3070819 RepID=UPI0032FABB20